MSLKYPWNIVLGAGVTLVLIILVGWFWSLGAVASQDIQQVRVEAVGGAVEVRRANEAEWREVSGAMEVATGDSIRTGQDGMAQIRWADRGVTRLDPDTEIALEEASGAFDALLRIRLVGGRVWSRMLKMIDADQGMEVRTSDVVATVRGTAFGVAKADEHSEAAVTESVVSVSETLLREGQWGAFDETGQPIEVRQLTDADAWAVENRERDRAFDEAMLQEIESRLKAYSEDVKGTPVWLLRLSERLRLSMLAGDKRDARAEAYALRHLGLMLENPSAFEMNLRAVESFANAVDDADRVQSALHAVVSVSLSAAQREDALFTEEQIARLREARARAAGTEQDALAIEAVSLDEDIDALLYGGSENVNPGALLGSIAEFVGRVQRSENLEADAADRLMRRAEAMGFRLGFEGFGNTAASDALRNEEDVLGNEQEEGATEEATQEGEVVGRIYQYISLYASAPRLRIGEEGSVTLYGITPSGETRELNEEAVFSVNPAFAGSITPTGVFLPKAEGMATITAVYRDAEGERTVSASIQIEPAIAAARLTGLRLAFTGPTTVPCSSSIPLRVLASYEDGTEKDVTIMSSKSVSDTRLLHVQDDTVLTFCAPEEASGVVYAAYSENGVRQTTQATVTVVPDPQSGGGTSGQQGSQSAPTLY